jgi:hypothetical protein
MTKGKGSNQSGRKRRFASRHIQDAECFRIPENPKIFVSVAIENHFLQNESQNSETSLPLRGETAYSPELVEGDEAIRHRSVVLSPVFNGTNVLHRKVNKNNYSFLRPG